MPCRGHGCDNCSSDIGPALKPSLRELGSVRCNAGTATDIHQNPLGRSGSDLLQGAGAAVASVEVTYITASQRLHHQRNAVMFPWRGEDMHMVGHEYPSMDCDVWCFLDRLGARGALQNNVGWEGARRGLVHRVSSDPLLQTRFPR